MIHRVNIQEYTPLTLKETKPWGLISFFGVVGAVPQFFVGKVINGTLITRANALVISGTCLLTIFYLFFKSYPKKQVEPKELRNNLNILPLSPQEWKDEQKQSISQMFLFELKDHVKKTDAAGKDIWSLVEEVVKEDTRFLAKIDQIGDFIKKETIGKDLILGNKSPDFDFYTKIFRLFSKESRILILASNFVKQHYYMQLSLVFCGETTKEIFNQLIDEDITHELTQGSSPYTDLNKLLKSQVGLLAFFIQLDCVNPLFKSKVAKIEADLSQWIQKYCNWEKPVIIEFLKQVYLSVLSKRKVEASGYCANRYFEGWELEKRKVIPQNFHKYAPKIADYISKSIDLLDVDSPTEQVPQLPEVRNDRCQG